MREFALTALILLIARTAGAQIVPAGWKLVKDAKGACQIAVPPDWIPFGESNGAAMLRDATVALAVVTSQPGQEFKPLPPSIARSVVVKDKLFENTPKRTFYQDKLSHNAEEQNGFSSSVPAKDGTCSCHVVALPGVSEDLLKKIALSLGPAQGQNVPTVAEK
jgi:hypothetical protein